MKKILVAYASKTGSTIEVAEAVAKELREKGYQVDVLPARQVKTVQGFDAVVLGTAIRIGKPVGEAMRFVSKHADKLTGVPVAVFSVGLAMKEDTPKSREDAMGFLKPITEVLKPASTAVFGGKLDYARLNPLFRFMFSRASNDMAEGDWRNWEDIRAWAASLAAQFQ